MNIYAQARPAPALAGGPRPAPAPRPPLASAFRGDPERIGARAHERRALSRRRRPARYRARVRVQHPRGRDAATPDSGMALLMRMALLAALAAVLVGSAEGLFAVSVRGPFRPCLRPATPLLLDFGDALESERPPGRTLALLEDNLYDCPLILPSNKNGGCWSRRLLEFLTLPELVMIASVAIAQPDCVWSALVGGGSSEESDEHHHHGHHGHHGHGHDHAHEARWLSR